MKLLMLTKYSRSGASSRLRLMQYIESFEKSLIFTKCSPLLGEYYIKCLNSGSKISRFYLLCCYLGRLYQVLLAFRYDVVLIEKELFPGLPPVFERLFRFLNIKFIVDYDDAVFLNYSGSNNKIDAVMKEASLVVYGSYFIKDRALGNGVENVFYMPTVIDTSRYLLHDPVESKNDVVTIGWIGSFSTVKYLEKIRPVLLRLSSCFEIRLVVVGADFVDDSIEVISLDWSEDSEVSIIYSFDIGVMPLTDTEWEKGKCAYKLIQYMGCQVPVVASPVGMNNYVVRHSIEGFLAETEEDWFNYLKALIDDSDLRKKMGSNGASRVKSKYSLESQSERFIKKISSVASS